MDIIEALIAGIGCFLLGGLGVMILVRTFQKLFIDSDTKILSFIFPDLKIYLTKLYRKVKHKN